MCDSQDHREQLPPLVSMFKDQVSEFLYPPFQLQLWKFPRVFPQRLYYKARQKCGMENKWDMNMQSHKLDRNELRSRRSSKIEDMDPPLELKKLDVPLVKKTTTAHLSTKALQISEEFAYDEVAVASEESDYQKSVYNSTIPSLSESVTPVSVLDGRLANFGVVTPGIFRSAWATADTYDFVKSLNLKTVVTLVQREVEDTAYTAFLAENGIRRYIIDMKGTKKQAIPTEMMQTILRLVLDKSNHPVLIHCNHGRHRTGCAVGVIRKIYGWDTQTILSEYQSFAHPKPRETDVSYLTTIEPSLFFQEPASNLLPRRKTFLRTLIFTFIGALIWLFTGYKFGNAIDRRHQG